MKRKMWICQLFASSPHSNTFLPFAASVFVPTRPLISFLELSARHNNLSQQINLAISCFISLGNQRTNIKKQGSSFMKLSPQFPDVFINIFWNICLKKWFWSLENKQIWGRERHQVYLWSSTIPPRCSQLGFPTWILQDLASSNIHL